MPYSALFRQIEIRERSRTKRLSAGIVILLRAPARTMAPPRKGSLTCGRLKRDRSYRSD